MNASRKPPKNSHIPSTPTTGMSGKNMQEPTVKTAGNLAADQYSTPASLRKLRIRQGG